MDIKRKLENIVWHIETNREILGDKRTLDDVWNALKIMVDKPDEGNK